MESTAFAEAEHVWVRTHSGNRLIEMCDPTRSDNLKNAESRQMSLKMNQVNESSWLLEDPVFVRIFLASSREIRNG